MMFDPQGKAFRREQQLEDAETFLHRLVDGAKSQEYINHLWVAIACVRAVRDSMPRTQPAATTGDGEVTIQHPCECGDPNCPFRDETVYPQQRDDTEAK